MQTIPFELSVAPEGGTTCQFADGRSVTISRSGIGYDFAIAFLHLFGIHHSHAIDSAKAWVRRMLGDTKVTARQEACLVASTCANCAFGVRDAQLDYDYDGRFHYEYSPCPVRDCCPYNGYRAHAAEDSICNPAFSTGLSGFDLRLADLLAHTGMTLAGIAVETGYTEGTVRIKASRIYEQLGLSGREALIDLGRGRRFAA